MPVQIGAKAYDFSDPTGLLSDCHRRIELFLASLQKVATVIDHPLADDARNALKGALRYFQEAAPKHTADEEQSLFPRMRRIDTPAVQNALATLDTLEKEHEKANVLHQDVHALGMQCLELGPLSAADTLRFRQALRELAAIYGEHIRVEDNEIFPTAQRALSDVDKAAIAAEMASRRNNRG